jgi:hypothetical protein
MAPRIYAGRFDPKFLGVAIRAKRAADVQSFRLSNHNEQPNISILAALNDDAVVSDLSRLTVLEHEIRHFHDSLLYPMGQHAIRARIFASFNGFETGIILIRLRGEANVLAVPLRDWLLMPLRSREAFLRSESHRTHRDLVTPALPVLNRDDDLSEFRPGAVEPADDHEAVIATCRLALAYYQRVEDLWRSPYGEGDEVVVMAVDIWEASGLICQLAAVESLAGNDMMQRFLGWMVSHGPRSYRRGLSALNVVLDQMAWQPTLRNYLMLASWSQLGPYKVELTDSAPGHRLGNLLAAVRLGKRWPSDWGFTDLAQGWDEITETGSIAALREASDLFMGFAARSAEQDNGLAQLLSPSLFTTLGAAHQRMLSAFLDDPDRYLDPSAYLVQRDAYPVPCVGITYPTEPDSGVDWIDATPADWDPQINFDDATSVAALAELADAIFLPGEKSLQTSGRFEIRKRLGLEAIRVIR